MLRDYIVIGAGSAGCALASTLVREGRSVVLLEAGGEDNSLHIKVPGAVLNSFEGHDWGYYALPDESRNNIPERWVRGRVLGGCSSINGMIYVRGANEDFDRWNSYCGNVGGWSAEDVVSVFKDFERSDKANSFRGRNGSLHVNTVRRPHRVTRAFVQAAESAGYEFNEDYNGARQEGVAYFQRTIHNGLRCSAADAFIRPIRRSPLLNLRLNSLVQRIEIVGEQATAVEFVQNGRAMRETARDIVICAGAIDTPKLLMLSGVGDTAELSRHGIATSIHSPNVGKNLREHPFVRLLYRSKVQTNNPTGGIAQGVSTALEYLMHREGPLAGGYESTLFMRSAPSESAPDLQLYFAPIGYGGKVGAGGALCKFPSFMVGLAKTRPKSTGCVRLASARPEDKPIIDLKLLSNESDVRTLVLGVERARAIMSQAPIADHVADELSPGTEVIGPEAIEAFVRRTAEISAHPNGTCRMGADEASVVTPELLVRGTSNLWIADASIMPDHLSANLNAVCMMIGAKLGKHLLGRSRAE